MGAGSPAKDGSVAVIDRRTTETNGQGGSRKTGGNDYANHPLATTNTITVDIENDEPSNCFVTYVKELHGISTFADNQMEALDMTAEMIRGYIKVNGGEPS